MVVSERGAVIPERSWRGNVLLGCGADTMNRESDAFEDTGDTVEVSGVR